MNEQLLKRLDALAEKLGTTASQLWQVLVYQAKIEAYENVVFSLIWFSAAVAGAYFARWLIKDSDHDSLGIFLLVAILSLISFLIGVWYLTTSFTELMNPQYWALTTVISTIGGIK